MTTRKPNADATYAAISRFVEAAFRTNDSIFTPERAIWTTDNRADLYDRFVGNPDESKKSFLEKIKGQMAGAPPDVIQLTAELLYVQLLTPSIVGTKKKLKLVDAVLELARSPNPVLLTDDLKQALSLGLANDMSFNLHRPWHLSFLLEVLRKWDKVESHRREELLQEPWEFKAFIKDVKDFAAQPMREMLYHFVHPDHFEVISSQKHKRMIVEAFTDRLEFPTGDRDRDISAIRQHLEAELDRTFTFYDSDIEKQWRVKTTDEDEEDVVVKPTPSLDKLANELLLESKFLRDIQHLLEDKRQVIFYGPPGTGKTFVAQKLAVCLAGSCERTKIVQFHPSYTYEDFFEGFRPEILNEQPVFKLHDGPLKRLTEDARNHPNETFILVIDEINRGNLAKIFGELYFLLEYRDHGIELQYSRDAFSLPENLWILGTMNTADRSIALIDAALRRRFYFVEFFPDRKPVKGLLRRWLQANSPDMTWVADVVDKANNELNERHLAVGPSHFMKPNLTTKWVERIWSHSVLPYLEEHFFGEPDRIGNFTLDKLRGRMQPGADSMPNDTSDTDLTETTSPGTEATDATSDPA